MTAWSDSFAAWDQWLCHPWVTALQVHGIVPCLLLGTLWILSGAVRLQELRRLRKNHGGGKGGPVLNGAAAPATSAHSGGGSSGGLPGVTVVLPTRGYRPNSVANWEAILDLEYDGPLEFIFSLEDPRDAASPVVSRLSAGVKRSGRSARVVHAGCASKSSQKIHNLMAGIAAAAPSSSYVLCLDDDVRLHPGALSSLIIDMEASPDLRVATGYPFDIPARGAGVLSYAALAYHLPLVIAFSLRRRTHFVWGGCMLFRAEDLRGDKLGFLAAWADGGYSDDLTAAARCTQLGLQVLCPSYAIFPQWIDAHYSPRRYWNYLRRQLCVLDTYASDHNRRTNHVMAVVHCYGSWGFVVPVVTAVLRLVLWALAAATTGGKAWQCAGGDALCDKGVASLLVFVGFTLYMAVALWWMTGVVCDLLEELSPQALKGTGLRQRFRWLPLWAGFTAANAVLPVCMAYTFLTRHITWAGVRYTRHRGKVVQVEHLDAEKRLNAAASRQNDNDEGTSSDTGFGETTR